MLQRNEILTIVQEVFKGLEESGVITGKVELNENTVLLGGGAVLNSIGFVTMFTDLEDRLGERTGKEIYLLLDEIHEFNQGNTFLTVGVLLSFIEKILKDLC